jgi:O-antigen biosynthesis protein
MKLSIIIVNYNVEHFLEQCLFSVTRSAEGIDSEVFVVDNNSSDGSVEMVKRKFPLVKLIENKKNTGFSFANNQAIKLAKAEYILLLNPDTVVEEDTFKKIIDFMDTTPDAGGLGVQMIDGKGNFLPESKRGLPTPEVAFYKIFGLSSLFPKSRRFGKYHLTYLSKKETHQVDVLSGAFMLLRKKALDKTGLLDETFFMYGEDIDLSYRILKEGFKNYYFSDTKIIHYKGESTKKSSVNYVFVFYKAMIIFARKHFSREYANIFSILIHLAVYLRASASILKRFFQKIWLPATDALIILGGLIGLKYYWEHVVKADQGLHFKEEIIAIAFPAYIFLWLVPVFFSGGYDKPVKLAKIIKGIAIGTAIILIFYSLLSEDYRFSRAMILLGAAWTTISILSIRIIFHYLQIQGFDLDTDKKKRIAIVGKLDEFNRVSGLLNLTEINPSFIWNISVDETPSFKNEAHIGPVTKLQHLVGLYGIDEVIFCARDLSAQKIMEFMAHTENVEYKIAPPESLYIIGSNSINTAGDLYTININSISKAANKRSKRLLDITVAGILLISFPMASFIVKKPSSFLKNIILVIIGKYSWVGYKEIADINNSNLPKVKKSILNPYDHLKLNGIDNHSIKKLNQLYAKDYNISNDFNIILKSFRHLGRKVI